MEDIIKPTRTRKKRETKLKTSAVKSTTRQMGCELIADDRDKLYPLSAITGPVSKPFSKSKIHKLGKVMDQGESFSCVGHALSLFIKTAPHMKRSPDPYELYNKAQLIDEFEGEEPRSAGTSIRAAIQILINENLIQSGYYWAFDAESIWRYIITRGPVVIGTKWYSGMNELDKKGFARIEGDSMGGHAYLVYGVNSDLKAFLCANSWGEEWGDKGRFWISFEDMGKLLAEGGQACSAEES